MRIENTKSCLSPLDWSRGEENSPEGLPVDVVWEAGLERGHQRLVVSGRGGLLLKERGLVGLVIKRLH